MATVLSRYLDPEVIGQIADNPLHPEGLVIGTLAGAHQSPLSGFAVEFAGHREYLRGDDPRHIDWRLFFRRDRLFIKQYEMETNFVAHLVLDISASMRYGEGDQQKLLYAQRLASVLAHLILRQNDKVSLTTFDQAIREHVPPSGSLAQLHRMMGALDRADPQQKTKLAKCLTELAGKFGRRELVFIISDFLTDLEALEAGLQRLRYHHHEVVLFEVLHHEERTFELAGMVKFAGLEDHDEQLAQTEDIRAAYLDAFSRHRAALEELCHRNRIEYVPVDTSQNLATGLVDYLTHRERVSK